MKWQTFLRHLDTPLRRDAIRALHTMQREGNGYIVPEMADWCLRSVRFALRDAGATQREEEKLMKWVKRHFINKGHYIDFAVLKSDQIIDFLKQMNHTYGSAFLDSEPIEILIGRELGELALIRALGHHVQFAGPATLVNWED